MPNRLSTWSIFFVLIMTGTTTTGCFNADSMIAAHRATAIGARLGEVDLGEFHVTLPQSFETIAVAEIQFHVFGQVANRDLKIVEESLEKNGPEIKHRLLIAARQLQPEEITDPKLASLRDHITTVFNETLPGEPLQSIGFYHFRYSDF